MKVSRLSSISAAGGGSSRSGGGEHDRECYLCGERRYKRRDCPGNGKLPRNKIHADPPELPLCQ